MSTGRSNREKGEHAGTAGSPAQEEAGLEQVPAWEQVESGRYRPRRIRGSCRGRELG